MALAIPYRRARDLVKPIAAFAVAHSITLTLAAAGVASADTWFAPAVGAAIALSLVYVALENAVGTARPARTGIERHRWVIAFVFGLAHGFGFAIALREILQFAGAHSLTALLAYNVGLELGTLIILAIAVPALNLLFTQVVAERAGIIAASVLIGHVGWHWMSERLAIARLSTWPAMDLTLLLTLVRWLLALTVIGGIVWFVSGFARRKPEIAPDGGEKSIVDLPVDSR